ncbi:MAG: alpha/beta hydrolase fold domain-containing protein [Flavisolibacter sp.]
MSILLNCRQNANADAPGTKDLPARTLRDVSYGNDSAQRMDIYLPAGRSEDSTKVLVLIHGGGWNSGSKSDFISYIDSFRKRMPDYAIFNINYRLVNGTNLFPAQEKDVRAALSFISGHAMEYAVSRNKIVLLGASAGAHLALLQAYKYSDPSVLAVIDFFGPTDLTAMYQHPWHPLVPYALQMITGTTPSGNPDLYFQSSPINFISSSSTPTLIFHGSNDPVVDLSQSKALKSKLEKARVKNELVVYPGQRHGWNGSILSNSFDRIEKFLKENIR